MLNTAPHREYTHWKQTVFYIQNVLTVKAGETMEGTLTCEPNAKNPRDLDISVSYKFDGSIGSAEGKQEYRLR